MIEISPAPIKTMPVFDFLNPVFTFPNESGKDRQHVKAAIMPEHEFYFKHKLISAFNQINGRCDTRFSFDSLVMFRYVVSTNIKASIAVQCGDDCFMLHIKYDQDHQPSYEVVARQNFYTNRSILLDNKMPSFSLTFYADSALNVERHEISRIFGLRDEDSFYLGYHFNDFQLVSKTVTYDGSDNFGNYDEHINKKFFDLDLDFEKFFNYIIEPVFKCQQIFFELYPEYSMENIFHASDFISFLEESKMLHENNAFESTIDENLEVLRMFYV